MRLAFVALLLGSAPLHPPAIHEPFTPLPCPRHPISTLALEGCREQAILRTDRQIDAQAKAIFALLRPAARSDFVRGERAWLVYRRATCAAEASRYAGGTAAPLLAAACAVDRNRRHLADLAQLRTTLARP